MATFFYAYICIFILQIVIEAARGDKSNGYIAVDDLLFDAAIKPPLCSVYPPEAEVVPTVSPPTEGTTPSPTNGPKACDFEQVWGDRKKFGKVGTIFEPSLSYVLAKDMASQVSNW